MVIWLDMARLGQRCDAAPVGCPPCNQQRLATVICRQCTDCNQDCHNRLCWFHSIGTVPYKNSDKQRINTGNSLLPHLRQQAEVPEGLVMTIMLIFASLASLGHVFRQLSILWHLSFLDIIVKICAYGDDDVTGLTLQSSEASLRLHRGVNVAAVV